MYKLLIVEDEEAIREGIIKGMDWQSMGFEVAGAASNGLEAIESVNSNPPDLILTDIRMPQMDGLELIEKTRLLYPDIRFVVLSGYSDFEYVQTALKNKVVDYLLKPTDIKEFETTFQRISRELDEERSRKYEYEVLKKQLRDSLPLLRDRFLYELVQGCSYDIDAISRKIKYLELDLNIGHARAAVFEIDSLSAEVNYLPEDRKIS
jgi:two-component system response regulator YesN